MFEVACRSKPYWPPPTTVTFSARKEPTLDPAAGKVMTRPPPPEVGWVAWMVIGRVALKLRSQTSPVPVYCRMLWLPDGHPGLAMMEPVLSPSMIGRLLMLMGPCSTVVPTNWKGTGLGRVELNAAALVQAGVSSVVPFSTAPNQIDCRILWSQMRM